jgi:DNA polymerase (family X)
VNRLDVAHVLEELAVLGELNGMDAFRTRAFRSAARYLEGTDVDLAELARAGRLTELKGVGPRIAGLIREIVETGGSALHDELREATPVGLHDLMRVPGLGTGRIRAIHQALGVDSLEALEAAAREGRLAKLPGLGARTEKKILEGITFVRASSGRRRYPAALQAALAFREWLRQFPGVSAAEVAGTLRRRIEVAEAVDLVAAAADPAAVVAAFEALNGIAEALPPVGGRAAARLADGLRVHLRCVAPEAFAAALVVDTGSPGHVEALTARAARSGLSLEPDGLREAGRLLPVETEAELYERLGLAYVPPELREGSGEIEAAEGGGLPRLVEVGDLRGVFHCHTTYSDGRATLAEMAGAARGRGWSYLGLGDHSRGAAYAGGLPVERVLEQHAEVDAWNAAHGGSGPGRFRILKGIESEIRADGSLDYPDEVLARFDYVVGSVHSGFRMSEEEMTGRMLTAVRNPYLTILGHPTGRLLLGRKGYAVDVRRVIDEAAERGVVLEINASPNRLDLDWGSARYAMERGARIAVNPDAHSVAGLDDVVYGINVARKAWLEPSRVLNTWTLDEVEAYLAERSEGRPGGSGA